MATQFFTQKVSQLKARDVSDQLIKEVAEELDISIHQVKEAIIHGQSAYTAHVMRSDTFDGVRWPWLGKFTAKTKTAQVLKHLKGLTKIQREFFLAREEFSLIRRKLRGK